MADYSPQEPEDASKIRLAVLKALRVAFVVGPVLIVVNGADYFWRGDTPPNLVPKALLTLFVPFSVSLYSSISYERELRREAEKHASRSGANLL